MTNEDDGLLGGIHKHTHTIWEALIMNGFGKQLTLKDTIFSPTLYIQFGTICFYIDILQFLKHSHSLPESGVTVDNEQMIHHYFSFHFVFDSPHQIIIIQH